MPLAGVPPRGDNGGTTTTTEPVDAPDPVGDLADRISDGCGPGDSWVCERVFESTENASLAAAAEWLVAKPATLLAVFAVAWVVNRIVRRIVGRWARGLVSPRLRQHAPSILQRTSDLNPRSESRAETITSVAKSVSSVAVWTLALFTGLSLIGLNIGPLLAGASVAGVALGFGAQTVVRDFLSGTFMVAEDQFGVGDVIEISGVIGTSNAVTGVVEKVTLRATRIRDVNGTVWHIPNGEIRRIGNKSQEWARALLDVQVTSDSDIDRTQGLIQRVADDFAADDDWKGEVIGAPEVWGVEDLGPDGISIRMVLKVTPASQWRITRELRARLKTTLDAEGVALVSVSAPIADT